MIKVDKKVIKEKKTIVVEEDVITYSIEGLSEEDARVLITVLYHVGGSPDTTYRGNISNIINAIRKNKDLDPDNIGAVYDSVFSDWYNKIDKTIEIDRSSIIFSKKDK